ncbi:MAG TPA: MFS transporter [Acidimicrobiales bacterium]|nr:MFS transporter [Acidimicrobiales bacterium]
MKAEVSPWSARTIAFLGAEALSAIGSWATIVAIWAYAAYRYDATPGQVAFFGIAFAVPGVVLGPVSGTVVDRLGPKATLAFAKVVGIAASLALLSADDFGTLSVLSGFHGVASAFSHPALQSMPPRLVSDHHLARTNALVSLTDELAIVLGPAAAGVAIAVFGFRGAFVFDAFTYAVGLAVLPLVRLRPVATAHGGPHPSVRIRDALEGWKLIIASGVLRRTVACGFSVHVLYGFALLAEPLYVRDALHRSEDVFAALQVAFGICLVMGGIAVARLGERLASFGWVAAGVAASGATAVVYLGTPWIAVAFAGVALWGVATAAISGPSRTVLQRGSPEAVHGRVLAAGGMAENGAQLLGLIVGGALVAALGVRSSVLGVGAVVSAAAIGLYVADRAERARAATPAL